MSAPVHAVHSAWPEYLALESSSNVKHESLDGQIYAMAGGTPRPAALQLAVPSLLFAQLRAGPCRALGAALRIRVLATALATYPDVTIVCGPRRVDPDDANSVTNPTLRVEVFSPSRANYARGEKFAHYKRIPSLRQYVLISPDEPWVEVWTRGAEDVWTSVMASPGEVADLEHRTCWLPSAFCSFLPSRCVAPPRMREHASSSRLAIWPKPLKSSVRQHVRCSLGSIGARLDVSELYAAVEEGRAT